MKHRMRLAPSLLALGAVATAACMGGPPPPEPLNPVRFLLISDLNEGDTLPGTPYNTGLARVATVRKRIADEGPLLFVAAGNVLAGQSGPRASNVDALNAARLDYATFGADELALPADTLARRIAASKFKWLSSNCAIGSPSASSAGAQILAWDTVRVATHKVGIFALTTPEGSHTGAREASSLRCSDPDSAAARAIETLVTQGADLIVALTNQPTAKDRDLLLRDSRIELILGGSDREPQTAAIADRHVLKSGAAAQATQFVTLWGGKEKWRQAVGLVHIDERLPADTAVAQAQKQIPAD